jgi:iron complex outermembrane recepter protein
MVFLQTTLRFHEKWTLTTGLSVNSSVQDIYRLQDAALDTSYRAAPSFGGVLAPRVGLAYQLGPNWSLHTSLSRGFSPPTIEEVRTNEGSINRQLKPEIGLNHEIGVRGYAQKLPIEWDITLFRMDLSQTIVSYVNEDGVVLFRNSGSTRQQGLEVMWAITPLEKLTGLVRKLKVSHSLTLNQFEFLRYQRQGVDYSGNALTGVPVRVSVSRMAMDLGKGFHGHFTWNYTDEIPLNDANTVKAPAYHLLQARLAYRWLTTKTGVWEIYSGADNLLNETYSLGNDLNVFGGRFYQPSPTRNYYLGVVWKR